MKYILRIIFIFFILIILLGLSTAYYFHRNGQVVFQEAIFSSIGHDVSFKEMQYSFPFTVTIKDLKIQDILTSKKVTMHLGIESIFSKRIILSNILIEEPIINLIKNNEVDKSGQTPIPQAKVSKKSSSKFEIVIRQIKLQDGSINYQYAAQKPVNIYLKNVDLKLSQISLPLSSMQSKYFLTAYINTDYSILSDKKVVSSGWFNLSKNDMDAELRLLNKNGNRALEAKLFSKDNELAVQGYMDYKISLNELGIKIPEQIQSQSNADKKLIPSNVNVGTFFKFNTKMNHFEISKISFSGSVATDDKSRTIAPVKN